MPGSNPRFVAKAQTLPVDMVFLDLEDSVAPTEKEAARAPVADAIKHGTGATRSSAVRVNDWSTQWTAFDIIEVVARAGRAPRRDHAPEGGEPRRRSSPPTWCCARPRSGPACPWATSASRPRSRRPPGLISVEEICAASARLEAVIFGPADFAASMEMPVLTGGVQIPEYPGDHFHYVFTKILMAGRANGLQVIDGPYLKIRDLDGLRDYCRRARALGFDGKWTLHPDQVPIVNEVFSPTQEQFDRAWAILDALDAAAGDEGKGAVRFGDEMVDEASRKMAVKLVARGERAGLVRTRPPQGQVEDDDD